MKNFVSKKTGKLSKLAMENIDDLSYSLFMKTLRKKDIKINGVRTSKDVQINKGDLVEVYCACVKTEKYKTIYVDDNIIVIDKKRGYSSENIFDDIKLEYKTACFIHRLDRNTAGLMLFALNEKAEEELINGFKHRLFDKRYLAKVVGVPREKNKQLIAYLFKDSKNSLVTVTDKKIKGSFIIKTEYDLVSTDGEISLLSVKLITGRTHQIRAHLAHIGLPILGDGKYGDYSANSRYGVNVQQLVANSLTLFFKENERLFYLNGKTFNSLEK